MKTIQITATDLKTSLLQIQNQIGGTINTDVKEQFLKVDSDEAFGYIRGMKLKGGISFIQFDICFNDDIKIVFTTPKQTLVNFTYCSEGKMSHTFDTRENRVDLETFQTGILSNITQEQNIIYFSRDVQTTACIISVNTLFGDSDKYIINSQLRRRFITDKTEDVAFISSPNLKIAQRMKQLRAIKQEGVVRTLLIEGLVHVILALEIEQHKKDIYKLENNTGSLTSKEMSKIKDLSEFINNFPETPLTVTELSNKIGLTPSKLQEGFKLMHGKTVNEFVRDVRVIKSEELITTTDMNISQILYTLGFSSRSYFSKIFKEKYNCSPSQYKAKNKLAVSA